MFIEPIVKAAFSIHEYMLTTNGKITRATQFLLKVMAHLPPLQKNYKEVRILHPPLKGYSCPLYFMLLRNTPGNSMLHTGIRTWPYKGKSFVDSDVRVFLCAPPEPITKALIICKGGGSRVAELQESESGEEVKDSGWQQQ